MDKTIESCDLIGQWPSIMQDLAKGVTYTITDAGKTVGELVPPTYISSKATDRSRAAAKQLLQFMQKRSAQTVADGEIKHLQEEGRD